MKADFELYRMLIDRLLNYDHLSFIKDIVKASENTEIIENLELHDQDKPDPPGEMLIKNPAFKNKQQIIFT